jgi:hypothetical protein
MENILFLLHLKALAALKPVMVNMLRVCLARGARPWPTSPMPYSASQYKTKRQDTPCPLIRHPKSASVLSLLLKPQLEWMKTPMP